MKPPYVKLAPSQDAQIGIDAGRFVRCRGCIRDAKTGRFVEHLEDAEDIAETAVSQTELVPRWGSTMGFSQLATAVAGLSEQLEEIERTLAGVDATLTVARSLSIAQLIGPLAAVLAVCQYDIDARLTERFLDHRDRLLEIHTTAADACHALARDPAALRRHPDLLRTLAQAMHAAGAGAVNMALHAGETRSASLIASGVARGAERLEAALSRTLDPVIVPEVLFWARPEHRQLVNSFRATATRLARHEAILAME